MPAFVGETDPPSWADQVKGVVRRRYTQLAEADAFPRGGAARARAAGYPQDWLEGLPARVAGTYCGCGYALEGVDLSGVRVAVDLGCGAGLDAQLVAGQLAPGAQVVALDLAPSMLARAGEVADALIGPAVGLVAADMERLPLVDGVADLVLANGSFNLTADKRAAFAEAARILRPGGQLIARDLVREGPLPVEIAEDPTAWNASLGGVLEEGTLCETVREAGFVDVSISHHRPFSVVVAVRVHAKRRTITSPGAGVA